MSFSPVPNIIDVLKSIKNYKRLPEDKSLASPWSRSNDLPYWFSRSAWSLVIIIQWYKKITKIAKPVIWVPDYFCDQSLVGIKPLAVIKFYPLTKDLRPEWSYLKSFSNEPAHFFLLVHYFGQPNKDTLQALNFCHQHKIHLIEDCAHVLLPHKDIGSVGDFILYSPHKWLGLPDGALLLVRQSFLKYLISDGQNEKACLHMLSHVINVACSAKNVVDLWLCKYLLRQCIHPNVLIFLRKMSRQSSLVKKHSSSHLSARSYQSKLSKLLIAQLKPKLAILASQRYANAACLADLLNGQSLAMDELYPYMFKLPLKQAEKIKNLSMPTCIWPDLPSEILNLAQHEQAQVFQKNNVFLPTHSAQYIQLLIRHLVKHQNAFNYNQYNLEIDWSIPLSNWFALFLKAPCSYIQQSYLYAEALRREKNWTPQFGVVLQNGRPIAVMTLLVKKGPFDMAIARLNRGPIWLEREINSKIQLALLSLLSREYSQRKGRILFFAPSMIENNYFLAKLPQLGFIRRHVGAWHSAYLDLASSEHYLRASLNPKWRNQLVVAEKKGLMIDVSEDLASFNWLVKCYAEFRRTHQFDGPSSQFLQYYKDAAEQYKQPLVCFRAFFNQQCVGGIAVACHGTTATYLIGYNSDEGRKLNANNLMLWQAVLWLKKSNYQWFDLGGINEYLTPGIAAFKKGMGGIEYTLVGEYVNWEFLT